MRHRRKMTRRCSAARACHDPPAGHSLSANRRVLSPGSSPSSAVGARAPTSRRETGAHRRRLPAAAGPASLPRPAWTPWSPRGCRDKQVLGTCPQSTPQTALRVHAPTRYCRAAHTWKGRDRGAPQPQTQLAAPCRITQRSTTRQGLPVSTSPGAGKSSTLPPSRPASRCALPLASASQIGSRHCWRAIGRDARARQAGSRCQPASAARPTPVRQPLRAAAPHGGSSRGETCQRGPPDGPLAAAGVLAAAARVVGGLHPARRCPPLRPPPTHTQVALVA